MIDFKDIEDAPRDGTPILAYYMNCYITDCPFVVLKYMNEPMDTGWVNVEDGSSYQEPTHYALLTRPA